MYLAENGTVIGAMAITLLHFRLRLLSFFFTRYFFSDECTFRKKVGRYLASAKQRCQDTLCCVVCVYVMCVCVCVYVYDVLRFCVGSWDIVCYCIKLFGIVRFCLVCCATVRSCIVGW